MNICPGEVKGFPEEGVALRQNDPKKDDHPSEDYLGVQDLLADHDGDNIPERTFQGEKNGGMNLGAESLGHGLDQKGYDRDEDCHVDKPQQCRGSDGTHIGKGLECNCAGKEKDRCRGQLDNRQSNGVHSPTEVTHGKDVQGDAEGKDQRQEIAEVEAHPRGKGHDQQSCSSKESPDSGYYRGPSPVEEGKEEGNHDHV